MYILAGNTIPPGNVVRHFICNDDRCIRPDHLLHGTQKDNIQDMHNAKRGKRYGIEILVCPNGHDLSLPQQVRVRKRAGRPDGRVCRKCEWERDTAARLVKRDAA